MQYLTTYNGMGEKESVIEGEVNDLQELADGWSLAKIILEDGTAMNNQFVKTADVKSIAAE